MLKEREEEFVTALNILIDWAETCRCIDLENILMTACVIRLDAYEGPRMKKAASHVRKAISEWRKHWQESND